jgi:hypothetical protein
MKILPVLVLALFCSTQAISQNKKEQIEQLVFSRDSLQLILEKERTTFKIQINELEEKSNALHDEIRGLKTEIESKNKEITVKEQEIVHLTNQLTSQKKEIDSLSQLLQPVNDLPDYFFGCWSDSPIEGQEHTCCNTMGCLCIDNFENGILISGLEWSSRYVNTTKESNFYIIEILGYGEGDCRSLTLVLLFENNILYAKEYWNDSFDYDNLPTKKELSPHYKCPPAKE